jgi:hypothetical protein
LSIFIANPVKVFLHQDKHLWREGREGGGGEGGDQPQRTCVLKPYNGLHKC